MYLTGRLKIMGRPCFIRLVEYAEVSFCEFYRKINYD